MSTEAETFVKRHSPYTGATRFLHYIMAETANDTYDYRLWMGDEAMASIVGVDRRTVIRAKAQMIQDGYLEELGVAGERGFKEYRFLFPGSSQEQISGGADVTSHPADVTSHPIEPISQLKGINGAEAPSSLEQDPETVSLCYQLARRVGEFRGSPNKAPGVTAKWLRGMRLLVERGPTGRARPEPLRTSKVRTSIDYLFDNLAEPDRKGFCWAGVVQSPVGLREHWDQIANAAKRGSRVSAESDGGTATDGFAPPARDYNE